MIEIVIVFVIVVIIVFVIGSNETIAVAKKEIIQGFPGCSKIIVEELEEITEEKDPEKFKTKIFQLIQELKEFKDEAADK